MPLETGEFITDLVITNPLGTDPKSQGDDHMRLIKKVVQQSFPNIDAAATPTPTEINSWEARITALESPLVANGIAWGFFNGDDGSTIFRSSGHWSFSKAGTGDYLLTWLTSQVDDKYGVVVCSMDASVTFARLNTGAQPNTVNIRIAQSTSTAANDGFFSVIAVREGGPFLKP